MIVNVCKALRLCSLNMDSKNNACMARYAHTLFQGGDFPGKTVTGVTVVLFCQ